MQRGGPSTGLPTKTEQADLLQVMFGRNGEAPVPVVAAQTASDCFDAALEAARIATDLPHPGLPALRRVPGQRLRTLADPGRQLVAGSAGGLRHGAERRRADFRPYLRDPQTLARPWAIPGTAGLEHRIGGIEKKDGTGDISYDPANHDHMVRTRAAKVAGIAVPPLEVDDPDGDAELLVLGWGSTYGPITGAVRVLRAQGVPVAQAHLRHLNPMPANTEEVLRRYRRVVVPEMNLGQLALLIRGLYLVDAIGVNQVRGQPFRVDDLVGAIRSVLDGTATRTAVGSAGRYGDRRRSRRSRSGTNPVRPNPVRPTMPSRRWCRRTPERARPRTAARDDRTDPDATQPGRPASRRPSRWPEPPRSS